MRTTNANQGETMTDQQGPQWGPPGQQPPQGAPRKPKRAWWKARWVPIVGAAILGLIVGSAGGGSGQSSTAAPAQTVTVTAPAVTSVKPATADEQAAIDAKNTQADQRSTALDQRESALAAREKAVGSTEATIAANTIPGDGTFLVGKDVKPGTYRTTGPKSGSSCYWQRSGDASGTNIIANDNIAGPTVVDIKSSDVAFKTSRCAAWTLAR